MDRREAGNRVEFHVLGPLQVTSDGQPVELDTARKPILLLAAMLVYAGRPVPAPQVLDVLWCDSPPASATKNIQLYAYRIRQVLGVHRVPHGPPQIHLAPGDLLDMQEFRRYTAQASAALATGDLARGSSSLQSALALWRGPAFVGFDQGPVADEAARLEEERLIAYERWAAAELQLGRADAVITELTALVRQHPYREKMRAHLMRGLHLVGRTVEALEHFRAIRARLVDELGLEPGPELQAEHALILRGEPTANGQPPAPGPVGEPARPAPVPRELLPGPMTFVGRSTELQRLDELLARTAVAQPGTATVAVVTGPAGVGKTALVLHWAHQVAAKFGDGQCFVDLRGFADAPHALTSADALRGLLETLGVPPSRIPADATARATLFRTIVADRVLLFVFDNVRDAEQVRPLLGASARSLTLITSRDVLPGLVASQGATAIPLGALPETEARALLAARLGQDVVAREPAATADIVSQCHGLPIALVIAAARSASSATLADAATRLGAAQPRLDAFRTDDVATDVRAVFSWSYQALRPRTADVFRIIGVHPSAEISLPVASVMAGIDVTATGDCLDELSRVNLVDRRPGDRYAAHDLVHAYAAELASGRAGAHRRREAVERALGYYLAVAVAADRTLYPHRCWIQSDEARLLIDAPSVETHDEAMAWFQVEAHNLAAMVDLAVDFGFDRQAWQLAGATVTYLDRCSEWGQIRRMHGLALVAAERLGDPIALAHTQRGLGLASRGLSEHAAAYVHYSESIRHFTAAGDSVGAAHGFLNRALVHDEEGRFDEGLQDSLRALAGFRAQRHRAGEAKALNNVGWFHAMLGCHEASLPNLEHALAISSELGDRYGQALTLDSLGYAEHGLGNYDRAVHAYEGSVALWEALGDRSTLAAVLTRLGASHHAAGNTNAARHRWTQAWTILCELDEPAADGVRAQIDATLT